MAQVVVYRKLIGRNDWVPIVAIPSLDPRSNVPNAIVYHTKAYDITNRQEVEIRCIGTGQSEPPPPPPRRMAGVPINYTSEL